MPTAQEEVEMNELIEKLQLSGNVLKRKYEAEKQRMKELHQLKRQVDAKILEQESKKQMKGGLDACAVQDKLETKKLSFLELRVNDLKRKLSLQVISNRQRKDQINSLRQKMVLFDTVHGSLGKEFGAHKESMASLMDDSNDVYNERQEALEKIRELVSLDLEESADHRALMEELGDLLDKEAQAREFIEKATKKQRAAKISNTIEESATAEEESALKNKLSDLKRNLKATKEHIKSVDARLVTAEAAFKQLREISGLETTREIVDLFIMNEDENYSLFNFIQQTKEEVDVEAKSMETIKKNMERFRKEQSKLSDHEFKVVNDLKHRREVAEEQISKIMRILVNRRLHLSQICTGVSHVFAHLGCDLGENTAGPEEGRATTAGPGAPGTPGSSTAPRTPSSPTMGGSASMTMISEGVQEANVMTYLGIIEQRSNEIIQEYVRTRAVANTPVRPGVTIRIANPFGPDTPYDKHRKSMKQPAPPVLDDALLDMEEEEDIVKPLNREEMISRVARTVDREKAATLIASESAPQLNANSKQSSPGMQRGGKRRGGRSKRKRGLGSTK
jgi:hypothetical protein